jgi:hypothetical protein
MPDLKTLFDAEAHSVRISADALAQTRLRVHRRQGRRRIAAGVVGLGAFVPAAIVAVWLGLVGRSGPAPDVPGNSPSGFGPAVTALSCPANRGLLEGKSTERGASETMIPWHPEVATLCHYGSVGSGRPSKLLGHWSVTQKVAAIARILNRLPVDPSNGVGYFCPFDNGSEAVLLLRYRDGGTATVEMHLTGCQMVSNGVITAHPTPAARGALEGLLRIRFGPS